MGLLFPGYGLGQQFDIVAHAVDTEAYLRILAQCLYIPAADLLDDAAADHVIGPGDGAELEEEKSSCLVHALMGECFYINKA